MNYMYALLQFEFVLIFFSHIQNRSAGLKKIIGTDCLYICYRKTDMSRVGPDQ